MDVNKLSGKEKAMVFLAALGDEASAKVLGSMPEKISAKISEELNFFPKPSQEMIAHVFKELNKLTLKAGPEEEKEMAKAIEDQLETKKQPEKRELPVDPLEKMEPGELLHCLQNEQVQTIAFVLSFISDTSRENFYKLLSPGRRKEIKDLKVAEHSLKQSVRNNIQRVLLAPQ